MSRPDAETMLRDALAAHTREITPGGDFVNATVDHSVASLRSTRRRQLLVGAGAAAVLVALVAWQAPSITNRSEQPPTSPSPSTVDDASAWAQSLPRGGDAEAAYIDGHTLVNGSQRVDLGRRARGWLVGPLPGGWLAALVTAEMGPGQDPTYGYLRADGSFLAYGYQPPSDGPAAQVGGEAVSPDGRLVAYGGAVVETGLSRPPPGLTQSADGQKIADVPADAAVIFDWTNAGLIYRDLPGHYWLWTPGSASVRLPYDEVVPGGFGYTQDGDCFTIGRVSPDASTPTYRICDKGAPLTVSANRRALMSDGELVNLEEGVDFLTLPIGVLPEQLQLFWESDDVLVLVVHDNADRPHPPVLVRCIVSAGLCERASDPLAAYPLLVQPPLPSR